MCGIIGYVGTKENALDVLISGLKRLEYRGYDSAGVAYVHDNKIKIIKEVGKIKSLEVLVNFSHQSNIGIGHTRWATHGGVCTKNSHPHKVGKITIVHNGIIENYEELRTVLIENGYKFNSETDTEIVAALIDKLYKEKNNLLTVINECKNLLIGSYALGIICDDELGNLYAIRKDSPLVLALDQTGFYIASDVPAILNYTKEYILIENNEILKITKTNYEIYNKKLELINKNVNIYEGDLESAEKSGFAHFMLKEIYEQPKVIKNTTNKYIYNDVDSLIKNMPSFKKYNKIDIVACGSAYHTGLIGKNLIEKYANVCVNVEIASEYRYKKLFIDSNTLVILVSQSGETADTLAALRIVKKYGADTLAIVNVVGSSIAREADEVIYIKAGPEIAVATTKAYSAQIIIFSLIALKLGLETKNLTEEKVINHIKEINLLPELIDNLLENKEYTNIASKIYNNNSIFFIGRKIDYAISMEGSLKLKEISYIHSEAYPAGELKHGTISLIENDTPVIAVITDSEIADKTISNIKEVKARGAKVIVVTTDELEKKYKFEEDKIIIPSVSELIQSNLTIIPLQILAYEIAKLRGCDIDKPRNLAKSVTVE